MKVAFATLGCKVNQYETEAISRIFMENGWELVGFDQLADVYVVNTCTVTNISDRKSRQMLRRAKKLNPDAVVAAVGCYAQTSPDEISGIEGVNVIVGNKDKNKAYELIMKTMLKKENTTSVSALSNQYDDFGITALRGKTRAVIKVQDGCNRYCTYCIIPYARGPVRSRPIKDAIEEVKRLAENGYTEVVLSGIHICSYGNDLKATALIDLLEEIHKIIGIKRIRLSSIEPNSFTDGFVSRLKALDKVCPHFHISLQSGCDKTLKRMNRRYDRAHYAGIVHKLRNTFETCSITTDLIVGFPGETEEEFSETTEFLNEIRFSFIHVFKYSPRRGTAAEKMKDQISPDIKEARSARVLELCKRHSEEFYSRFIGKTEEVLFESKEKDCFSGLSNNYIKVYAKSGFDLREGYYNVLLTGLYKDGLKGELIL